MSFKHFFYKRNQDLVIISIILGIQFFVEHDYTGFLYKFTLARGINRLARIQKYKPKKCYKHDTIIKQ